MHSERAAERVDVVVIGAGQAGLSVGYHLARRRVPFVILEASARVGDVWRSRWDSLRLFTPAWLDGLPGMPFPASRYTFPGKEAMADYLEAYAARFQLPVRTGVRVERLARQGERYVVLGGGRRLEARHVVVAAASYQRPRVPAFAAELDPGIVQVHSSDYRNPSQLRPGGVLVVGAGNSGAEIALEAARSGHVTWLSGRDTGHVPFQIEGVAGRHLLAPLLLRLVFHRVMTLSTPVGRKARRNVIGRGTPLIRLKPRDLAAAGVERVPRTGRVRDGRPVLEDGRTLDAANVVWCTGFDSGLEWIDIPGVGGAHEPAHARGAVVGEPGLYFVGLHFLYAMSSAMIHGVGRDAEHVADVIARRRGVGSAAADAAVAAPGAVAASAAVLPAGAGSGRVPASTASARDTA